MLVKWLLFNGEAFLKFQNEIGGIVMKDRFLRKYKLEVIDSSVDYFDYCRDKFYHQLIQRGHDDISAQIGAVIMLNINGINRGISL